MIIDSFASLAPQSEHFMRDRIALREPAPHALATSNPPKVKLLPHAVHSTLSDALKRTRSEAVRMCLVDIHLVVSA